MGGGGQSSSGQGVSNTSVTLPYNLGKEVKPWETRALEQELTAQLGLPSIANLYGQVPLQGTAPLTADQLNTINQYEGLGTGQANPSQSTALGTLTNYATGSDITKDPAFQAANAQFSRFTSPQIASQAALQGQGNSGAALEAQSLGQLNTLAPYVENAQANQLGASNELFSAGSSLNTQQLNDMSAKLQAEGIPQTEAQNIANALFQQRQNRFNYASGVQQQPLQFLPNLTGSHTTNITSGTTGQSK